MGIPKYHKWLTERYPDAFAEAWKESADHVYVDVNALLHDCMRHAQNKEGFFQHLFTKFDALFRTVAPSKTVFLAVDGPASCAKCLTQRTRRRAHAQKDAKSDKKGKGKGKGKGKKGGHDSGLSNNMLTPGVPFMTELTNALEYYAASRMAPNQLLARCQAVTVSGANAIGEGEHKIVSQMLRNAAAAGANAANESHVVSSGDADIFLLSLVQSGCRKVRVVSERPAAAGDKRGRGSILQIWNAEVLARYIAGELADGPQRSHTPGDEAALRRDFALISLLAGNDYLPELRCNFDPQKLWDQYLKLRKTTFPDCPLIQAYPTDEGIPLSHMEGGWALTVGETGAAFAVEPYEHYAFHQPLLLDLMKAAGGGNGGTQLADRSAQGVRRYLEGLLWIMEMYHHGYCGDFYFGMEKSFHSSASATCIVQLLSGLAEEDILTPPRSECPPMRPLACALCILPVDNAEKFLSPTAPGLKPMFSTSHPLLGSVNAIEKSEELAACKTNVARLHQEMMSLRGLGRDDTAVKAQLTQCQQKMEALRKGGSDIDVVPLQEVDAEVARRCAGTKLRSLEFAPDVTLCRGPGGKLGKPFSLPPPVQRMGVANCNGLRYVTGEFPPQAEGGGIVVRRDRTAECVGESLEEEPCYEEVEEEEESMDLWVEEEAGVEVEGDTSRSTTAFRPPGLVRPQGRSAGGQAAVVEVEEMEEAYSEDVEEVEDVDTVAAGEDVEGYWPDDDTWLPASINLVHADGSFSICWAEDGSLSDVPADYVRQLQREPLEPLAKRARRG
mmetsp:Transcript_97886/g.281220  ORF Transcript_97886/g.281220 Transcript_97886/m.281220 type:complete len:783 (+) Transcript_97886:91-2439(+)